MSDSNDRRESRRKGIQEALAAAVSVWFLLLMCFLLPFSVSTRVSCSRNSCHRQKCSFPTAAAFLRAGVCCILVALLSSGICCHANVVLFIQHPCQEESRGSLSRRRKQRRLDKTGRHLGRNQRGSRVTRRSTL